MMAGAPQETTDQVMNTLVSNHLVERFHRYDSPYYKTPRNYLYLCNGMAASNGRLEALQVKSVTRCWLTLKNTVTIAPLPMTN